MLKQFSNEYLRKNQPRDYVNRVKMAKNPKKLSSTKLYVSVLKEKEKVKEEQKVSFRTWYPKSKKGPTKGTLKQVNYKIDFKVTKINAQLSIRDYANRVKMAQAKKKAQGHCIVFRC